MTRRLVQFGLVFLAAAALAAGGCAKKSAGAAAKWDAEVKAEKGPVEVKVRVDRKSITLAGEFIVELEAAAQEGYEVTMPKAELLMKDFGLRDWRDEGKKLDDKGRVVRIVRCELDPMVSGKYEIPALEFGFRKTGAAEPNDAEKAYTVSTDPIEVEVTSLLKEQKEKLEIADIEGVMEMPRQVKGLWWWVGGCVLGACAAGGVWIVLRKKSGRVTAAVRIPAHELAYQRLRDLVAEDLVGQGRIKEFYEGMSNILRHYIEDRFDLRAPERTTEEFLYELGDSNALEQGDKEMLKEFMTHCDLVKFAKFEPGAGQIQKTFDLVKEFIEKTRSDLRVVDQPEPVAEAKEDA
jgi:hypothetical protein